MTREEAIKELKEDIELYIPLHGTIDDVDRDLPDGRLITALEMGIKALEQEPCDNAVSRQAVIDIVDSYSDSQSNVEDVTQDIISYIVALPPVNPQPYEDAISREATLKPYNGLNDEDTISVWLIRKNIEQQPPVNPQPKTGHWIISPNDCFATCSECGLSGDKGIFKHYRWCPICGAKMSEIPTGSELQESEKVN